MDIMTELT